MAKTNPVETIRPHLSIIQGWVNTNITENVALPSKEIGIRLTELIPNMEAEDIAVGFRALVKSGDVTGIVGKRKIGYCRPDRVNQSKSPAPEDSEDVPTGACIRLSRNQRIYAVDTRNWALQAWNGSQWVSQAYWGTLDKAMKGTAQRLLNKEIKATISTDKLDSLTQTILAAETRILENLQQVAQPTTPQ